MTAKRVTKKQLQEQLEEVQKRLDELKEQLKKKEEELLRAVADVQNLRRRLEEEHERGRKTGRMEVALKLAETVEHLINALKMAEESASDSSFSTGFRMIREEIEKKLEQSGIKLLDPVGDNFDHRYHHAVSVVETEDMDDGKVLNVVRKGIIFEDTVIKPCLVTVSKKKNLKNNNGGD